MPQQGSENSFQLVLAIPSRTPSSINPTPTPTTTPPPSPRRCPSPATTAASAAPRTARAARPPGPAPAPPPSGPSRSARQSPRPRPYPPKGGQQVVQLAPLHGRQQPRHQRVKGGHVAQVGEQRGEARGAQAVAGQALRQAGGGGERRRWAAHARGGRHAGSFVRWPDKGKKGTHGAATSAG